MLNIMAKELGALQKMKYNVIRLALFQIHTKKIIDDEQQKILLEFVEQKDTQLFSYVEEFQVCSLHVDDHL